MFLISTTTFLLATIHEASFIAFNCAWIHSVFSKNPALVMMTAKEKLPIVLLWIDGIHITINDATVVWRAFVLLRNGRWRSMALAFIFLLLLSFTATSAAYTIVKSPEFKNPPSNKVSRSLAFARYGLSLGTNIVATIAIGYVYWVHRKDMVTGLGNHRPTQSERVLALLVESGVAFCIPQALNFLVPFFIPISKIPAKYFATVVWSGYVGLASVYPTMVIALVNNHRTLDKMYSIGSSLNIDMGTSHSEVATLQFAHTTSSMPIPQETNYKESSQQD
ncbi:hypothetical protein BDZ94DRAFT_1301999 [Collybia nuda]|uniref:Uncharacterized protein n=1 Tax=Collybia nuda TaxID=64659 RepID=A0A9P6CDP9_9AGAR|nr:hypothetical protein BDZ94DRAFT_1301999 [Collybia nuda]